MIKHPARSTFWVIALTLAATLAATGLWRWHTAAADLNRAAADGYAAADYARQVLDARSSPHRIAEQEMQLDLLAKLIENAADHAGITRRSLDRIWPQPARRINDSAYQRKSTQLLVRHITTLQAAKFLHQLATGPHALSVDSLRLTVPTGQQRDDTPVDPETWNLEVAISHLLYRPVYPEPLTSFAQTHATPTPGSPGSPSPGTLKPPPTP